MRYIMTPQEISDYKLKWKPGFQVDVHSDLHIDCKYWCRQKLERWEWSMNTWTGVYSHTFYFEKQEHADRFTEKFKDWVNKGKD